MSDARHENRLSDDRGLKMRMRSEERRISSQHVQLGDLFNRMMGTLAAGGGRRAVGDFLLFETALQAHLSVEEEIYFPALHGLRNDAAEELEELVDEHERIRAQLPGCQRCLEADEGQEASRVLSELADSIDSHEKREEDLLARITEGPVADLASTPPGRSAI